VLVEPPILHPGTVDDLIADARVMGHKATQRMIMDWQTLGLIDYPQPQGGAGRGKGSKKALYSINQRKLFRELVRKRGEIKRIANLTVIPVSLWLYWGDEYVPLHQVRRALKTFVGRFDATSRDRAKDIALTLTTQLAHPDVGEPQRTKLTKMLTAAIHDGRQPDQQLQDALQQAFDPAEEGRTVGPPAAPVTATAFIKITLGRLQAADAIVTDTIPNETFHRARDMQRDSLRGYLQTQPELAASAGNLAEIYSAPTWNDLVRRACSDLLNALGIAMTAATAESAPTA
jgi:hypothetical protein